jgi:hypothetical protein
LAPHLQPVGGRAKSSDPGGVPARIITEQLTNSTGVVTKALQYDAFGTALNFAPSAVGVDFLFAGDAIYDLAVAVML